MAAKKDEKTEGALTQPAQEARKGPSPWEEDAPRPVVAKEAAEAIGAALEQKVAEVVAEATASEIGPGTATCFAKMGSVMMNYSARQMKVQVTLPFPDTDLTELEQLAQMLGAMKDHLVKLDVTVISGPKAKGKRGAKGQAGLPV
jgi:hypothetical protein